jgi:Predicted SAM-dependent methyltransferase
MAPSLTDRIAAAGKALLARGRAPEQPLSPRLRAVADLVPSGASVVDVGTDHAWLVVHLLHERRVPGAIAADVNAAPLDGARARIDAHRLGKHVDVRQGDGLAVVSRVRPPN